LVNLVLRLLSPGLQVRLADRLLAVMVLLIVQWLLPALPAMLALLLATLPALRLGLLLVL